MFKKSFSKFVVALAILSVGIMAQQRDYAEGNRLYINGQPVFISGMNLAWLSYAYDVGDSPLQSSRAREYLSDLSKAGGNAVRWWLHTDAQICPKMDSDGKVTGLGMETIKNMRAFLDIAWEYKVLVSMCLFSFDLLHGEIGTTDNGNKTSEMVARNEKFLTIPSNLDSYIEKALRPILDSVGSHPAIMCWEVFNEPEGMSKPVGQNTDGGWASRTIDHSHIMRFTNRIAGEVRRRTNKMASTGIHNFSQYKGVYTTENLIAAGGDEDGWLDFYMAHHYPEYDDAEESPFNQDASHWNYDRPILIGEFPAQSWDEGSVYPGKYKMSITDAYEAAYKRGYCGAMSWAMTEGNWWKFGSFQTTKPALEYMYQKYRNDIEVTGTGWTSIRAAQSMRKPVISTPAVAVRGRVLNIANVDDSPMTVRLFNVHGRTVARFKAQGNEQFSLTTIPAGRYVVEIKKAGKLVNKSAVNVR